MILFPILAQTATFADAHLGRSLASLFGLLILAGTAVALARWYFDYLRGKGERQRRIIEDFNISHAELQKKFQEQLDRLSDRQQESQQDFQAYVAIMSDIQTMILRDVIVTIRNIEKINGGSAVATHGLTTTIRTVWPAIHALDSAQCDAADGEI
jgi:phosphoenolpyruvate-protein kinase (PTS system EI component)